MSTQTNENKPFGGPSQHLSGQAYDVGGSAAASTTKKRIALGDVASEHYPDGLEHDHDPDGTPGQSSSPALDGSSPTATLEGERNQPEELHSTYSNESGNDPTEPQKQSELSEGPEWLNEPIRGRMTAQLPGLRGPFPLYHVGAVRHDTWVKQSLHTSKCDKCSRRGSGDTGVLQRCGRCNQQWCRACMVDVCADGLHYAVVDELDWTKPNTRPRTKAKATANRKVPTRTARYQVYGASEAGESTSDGEEGVDAKAEDKDSEDEDSFARSTARLQQEPTAPLKSTQRMSGSESANKQTDHSRFEETPFHRQPEFASARTFQLVGTSPLSQVRSRPDAARNSRRAKPFRYIPDLSSYASTNSPSTHGSGSPTLEQLQTSDLEKDKENEYTLFVESSFQTNRIAAERAEDRSNDTAGATDNKNAEEKDTPTRRDSHYRSTHGEGPYLARLQQKAVSRDASEYDQKRAKRSFDRTMEDEDAHEGRYRYGGRRGDRRDEQDFEDRPYQGSSHKLGSASKRRRTEGARSHGVMPGGFEDEESDTIPYGQRSRVAETSRRGMERVGRAASESDPFELEPFIQKKIDDLYKKDEEKAVMAAENRILHEMQRMWDEHPGLQKLKEEGRDDEAMDILALAKASAYKKAGIKPPSSTQ